MSEKVKNQKYERKFVVLLPDMIALSNRYDISTVLITQTFLKNTNKDGDCHVRIEERNGVKRYFYGRKVCNREKGLRIVLDDYEITKEEHDDLIRERAHSHAAVVEKTRHIFVYKEQTFNLDILKKEVDNMLSKKEGILMIEMPFPEEHLEMPRHIFIEREITNDMGYTTKSLAKLQKKSASKSWMKKLINYIQNLLEKIFKK